jgi:Mg-chelatase subunit ChlI
MQRTMVAAALVASTLLQGIAPAVAQTDFASQAELDAQTRRLESALNRIQLEQQSVYQQFQMMQELRRSEQQQTYQSSQTYTPPPTPPNYEDQVREQQARDARMQGYQSELDRLYARYRELEAQKQPLLDELSALAQRRR